MNMKRTLDLYKVIHPELWTEFDGLINFCPSNHMIHFRQM